MKKDKKIKKIFYKEGPPALDIVNVGRFVIGVPKEVDAEIADLLLKKGKFLLYNEEENLEEEV